jgi:hypothetical protein
MQQVGYDGAMPSSKRSPASHRKLLGDLTVEDARHILHIEGGELTRSEIVVRLISLIAISALSARAIVIGNATVWHLALPMVAQYFAIILSIPVLYGMLRHPELRKDAISSVRLWIGIVVAMAIATAVRSFVLGAPWQEQAARDGASVWEWITAAEMHWPILLAFCGEVAAMPARARNVAEHGPPFVSINLGCAMRFVVLMLGCFVLPWAIANVERMAWFLWGMILLAEILALWMHWSIQRRLRTLDGRNGLPNR